MDAKFWTEVLKGYQAHPELIIATVYVVAIEALTQSWEVTPCRRFYRR